MQTTEPANPTSTPYQLLDRLREKKGDQSERALARKLGVRPSTVNDALAGRIPPADTLLIGIAGVYPDLDADICTYLRQRFAERMTSLHEHEAESAA